MGEVKWTKAQQKVIELKSRNILVSAAAGSGKTAVLVERILNMISRKENPIDVDHLLVVTFTNAAAGEMRERIGKAIEKRLEEDKDNLHLQKQMTLLHNAQITTIHSFCLQVIRSHFHLIDLDPAFRMGDEPELKLLKSDVIAQLLENKYQEQDKGFLQFIESYSTGKSDEGIEKMILGLYHISVSYPWPLEWLSNCKKAYEMETIMEMEKTSWMDMLLTYIHSMLHSIMKQVDWAERICLMENGPKAYLGGITSDKFQIKRLLENKTYESLSNGFLNFSWEKLKRISKKDEVNEELQGQLKGIRKEIKDRVESIRKKYFFQSPQEMLYDLKAVKDGMNIWIDLTIEFSKAFQEKKEEKKLVDFNDLEHFALNILVEKGEDGKQIPTLAAKELSEEYEEIMIDEYQDSNLVQELLLTSISRGRIGKPNLFMVGDVKQSIYKFRLARPEIFMEKYEKYVKWEEGESDCQRVDLHKNFRSRNVVLDSTNFIFRSIMKKELGNIQYDDNAALYQGIEFEECDGKVSDSTECILVYEGENEKEILKELSEREGEGAAIALRIKELVSEEKGIQVFDRETGEYRRAEYGDIVILLRTMSGWSEDFLEILLAEGIPAYTDTQSGYFSAIEVKTALNLLRIIDNPRQDIPLCAVLYSPIVGMSSEDLSWIRSEQRNVSLYEALIFYRESGTRTDLQIKVSNFLDQLESYRNLVPVTDIHDLLQKILLDTGYYQYVSVMPAGEVRKANLDMLIQKAVDFEETSYRGLFHFNQYIEKLHKYEVDFGEANINKNGRNAVRIMSIHKSKGLEFPIVFLSAMGKMFNNQDSRNKVVIHPDLGVGGDFVDLTLRTKTVTLMKRVMQGQLVLENLGEELRILYVAMTRAKEKLILTGFMKKKEETIKKYKRIIFDEQNQLPFYQLAEGNRYLDWVLPVIYHGEKGQCSTDMSPSNNGNHFSIQYISVFDLVKEEVENQIEKKVEKDTLYSWNTEIIYNKEVREQIEQGIKYEYPYEKQGMIPGKMTVTELKKRADLLEEEGESLFLDVKVQEKYIPGFADISIGENLKSSMMSSAKRGSLYHRIMEWIRIENSMDVHKELEYLSEIGKIPKDAMIEIDSSKILKLTQTDLFQRMAVSNREQKLYREQKFVMGIPAVQMDPSLPKEETILVQGIIDVYFEEENELVLVDYKTDVIHKGSENELVKRYLAQFDYYQEALEKLTGKKVKERYLYSFHLGCAILM